MRFITALDWNPHTRHSGGKWDGAAQVFVNVDHIVWIDMCDNIGALHTVDGKELSTPREFESDADLIKWILGSRDALSWQEDSYYDDFKVDDFTCRYVKDGGGCRISVDGFDYEVFKGFPKGEEHATIFEYTVRGWDEVPPRAGFLYVRPSNAPLTGLARAFLKLTPSNTTDDFKVWHYRDGETKGPGVPFTRGELEQQHQAASNF